MKRSKVCHRMWNGGLRHSGSKNQALAPVVYEYRKPHRPGKPGYYSLKSFYTLGCFPSGLEAPYRLDDFHKNYLRAYVPEELEDWLDEVRPNPIETASASLRTLKEELSMVTLGQATKWRPKPMLTALEKISQPIEDIVNAFIDDRVWRKDNSFYPFVPKKQRNSSFRIPNVVTRHLLNNYFNELTEITELLDETWELMKTTQHPFLPSKFQRDELLASAREEKGENLIEDSKNSFDTPPHQPPRTHIMKTPSATAPSPSTQKISLEDDILLCHFNNLISRAACEAHEYDCGISLTQTTLFSHAHDDVRAAKAHCDLATLWYKKGEYDTAIVHAQRAVILGEYGRSSEQSQSHPGMTRGDSRGVDFAVVDDAYETNHASVVVQGYSIWSTSLAQQDHLEDALILAARCSEGKPDNQTALSNLRKLQRFACGRVATPLKHRSLRCYNAEKIREGVNVVPFKLVHHSVINRSTGYHWMFWNHPMGLNYKYDPRGF